MTKSVDGQFLTVTFCRRSDAHWQKLHLLFLKELPHSKPARCDSYPLIGWINRRPLWRTSRITLPMAGITVIFWYVFDLNAVNLTALLYSNVRWAFALHMPQFVLVCCC